MAEKHPPLQIKHYTERGDGTPVVVHQKGNVVTETLDPTRKENFFERVQASLARLAKAEKEELG